MADGWRIDVNDKRLKIALNELPKELERRLEVEVRKLTSQLLRLVEAREPVKTGRLRRQTHAYVDVSQIPNKRYVRGRVRILPVQSGINRTVAAFGALEYGAPGKSGRRKGRVDVSAYRRRGGESVAAYNRRRPTIHARRFLRGAAAVMLPKARTVIGLTLAKFAREALKR
jgi:hypothetical protein